MQADERIRARRRRLHYIALVAEQRFDADYDPDELVGTGRHLTKQELFTWTRFLDAGRLLEEILAGYVAKEHNMALSDYEVSFPEGRPARCNPVSAPSDCRDEGLSTR